MREQWGMEESKKRKARITFGSADAKTVVFGMFLLIELASNIKMPEHQTHENQTYIKQVMNRFHKVNELYDGTLN